MESKSKSERREVERILRAARIRNKQARKAAVRERFIAEHGYSLGGAR